MIDPLSALEASIVVWAGGRADVRAVVVVGSRARSLHPADAWSDLDLILFSALFGSARILHRRPGLARRLGRSADIAAIWELPFPAPAYEQLLARWAEAGSGAG